MKNNCKVLFLKQLSNYQLVKCSYTIDFFDFIKIRPIAFEYISTPDDNLIFTSKKAVDIVLGRHQLSNMQQVYAVGKKTQETLMKYGDFQNVKVPKIKQNSKGIIDLIKEDKTDNFVYFCGKKRLPYLEDYFKENAKKYKAMEVYDTLLSPPSGIDTEAYNWLCFCSPTAVFSYLGKYDILPKHKILCIGKTTAAVLNNYEKQLNIAPEPSVKSMLNYIEKYQNK